MEENKNRNKEEGKERKIVFGSRRVWGEVGGGHDDGSYRKKRKTVGPGLGKRTEMRRRGKGQKRKGSHKYGLLLIAGPKELDGMKCTVGASG